MVYLGPGVGAFFTDRHGGVSAPPYDSLNLGGSVGDDPEAVLENRRRAAASHGLDPARVVWMRQIHSADAVRVDGTASPGEVDAVVTTEPGLALGSLAADCAPVLAADPVARVVGAAHAGRVGMAAGVAPALVEEMVRAGARPERMIAVIGPCACGDCYEVSAEMREDVARAVPAAWATTRAGTPGLDIRAGVAEQLAKAGVGEISHDARCTMESPELYSHRRDRLTGRFAGYVWLEK
ncbi:peptidoglycan editing factor PgeF [Bailinhaonella thermotolerans]|uniref:Purine nucleoside phosphorylase n=1 Tax=Bailinhaonella thermotolerans TaxID=1070861 RepID=A0A3A4BJ09_9ACTN|nr:peptidoglycan editing factor PgeF [Bailinhaonella thermotolerans]RJL31232.1 peptidoglycan editing factor PgeF [Bailinhaonella thermotolerans]